MSAESSVLKRAQLFEGNTPKKQIGAARPRMQSLKRESENRDDAPQTAAAPTGELVGVRSIEWPSDDDEKEIPAPKKGHTVAREVSEKRDVSSPLQNRSSGQSLRLLNANSAKSETEKKPAIRRAIDENTNPVGASIEWPSEDESEAKNPAMGQPSAKHLHDSVETNGTERVRKVRVEPRRRETSQRVIESDASTKAGRSASENTKSHLNDALKRSLNDASTVLHEERASSVATSSSSLSTDELTNIAKRALQASQRNTTRRRQDDDDATIGSVSTSRSARFQIAKQRVLYRKRIEDDDTASICSVKSAGSQQQLRTRALALAAQAQTRKKDGIVHDAMSSDDVSHVSNESRSTAPGKVAPASRQRTPPRKDAFSSPYRAPPASSDHEVRTTGRTELTPTRGIAQRAGRESGPTDKIVGHRMKDSFPNDNVTKQLQNSSRTDSVSPFRRDAAQQKTVTTATRQALSLSRSNSSPKPDSRQEHAMDNDARDDVSVASQSSNASRRQSRRRAFLASAERTRSANEQGRKSSPALKSRAESPLKTEACDDGSVGSMSSNPSRRDLRGGTPASTHKNARSTSPLVHPSDIAPRDKNINDIASSSIQQELNTKTEHHKIEIDVRLHDVIDPNAKATDEGIPRVRSLNVEASGSNLSETTQRVRNTRDNDRAHASPGGRAATTSRAITNSRSAPKDAPAALSVSRERARMLRYKERAESPVDNSLRALHDVAPHIVFKREARSDQRQDGTMPESTSSHPTMHNESSKPRSETTASKSKETSRSLATPSRLTKAEMYRQRDAQRTDSVSPKGNRRVDHPVFTEKSNPTSPRASPRNSARSPRSKRSNEMSSYSPSIRLLNDGVETVDSPASSITSARLEAFEKANAKKRLHPVSMGPSKAKEYKKEAALRIKTPSPKREKIATHRAFRGSSPPTSPSRAQTSDHHAKVLDAGPNSAVKPKATVASALPSEVDDYAGNRPGKMTSISSAEKPLASRNPYLAHLQQKQSNTHAPLGLSAAHHGTNATSTTPANIALSLREVTQASKDKSGSGREVTTNDGEASDETSSDHDIYSLTKPSEDSMLAYSESEAGSAFSGVKMIANKYEGGSRLPDSVPEDRCVDARSNEVTSLKNNDANPSRVKSLGNSVATDKGDEIHVPLPNKPLCNSVAPGGIDERLMESGKSETASNSIKSKAPATPNSSERFAKEAGLQLSAALQWWQANYAQNQDENVNKLVEDALTRLSSETSYIKVPTPQGSVSQRESGKICDGDGQSIATDEGSIFSGLDETTKGNSIISADETTDKADEAGEVLPLTSAPVPATGTRNETSDRKDVTGNLLAPPPPPQKHVGDVLDEGELLDTVNSDITSSVVALEGGRDLGRSMVPTAMIKEEESVDIKEENDTDRSDKGGKSRSSHKTTFSDKSTMGGRSKSSGTASESAGTSTATGQSGKKSKASRNKAKSRTPDRTCDKSDSRDVSEADASTEIPLFHCSGDGPRVESKDSTLKAVFMKFGHSILDRFEIVCRGPGEYPPWWINTFDIPTSNSPYHIMSFVLSRHSGYTWQTRRRFYNA